MKYHKKLKRLDLTKYPWQQVMMMAASEFLRADSLNSGKEMDNCLLRAKELLGVIENDPTIPQDTGHKIFDLTVKLVNLDKIDPKTFYDQSMALASKSS